MTPVRRIIGKLLHIYHINASKLLSTRGRVLMLHWVDDEMQDEETEPYRISTDQCRKFLQWLKGKNTIRLENWDGKLDFYALTIDDVPENFYRNAYPLLKDVGIPFTIFVNVLLLDTDGYITKEQLIEMSQCNLCTVGSHGINHGEFALLNKEQARRDLFDSKRELERIIGKPIEMFAYPYGSYYACGYANKYLVGGVYKYAFGTVACPITNPLLLKKYFLPRINVDVKFLNTI